MSGTTAIPKQAGAEAVKPRWQRLLTGGTQSAFSASLLLMGSSLLSGLLSLLRQKLVARYFGAGPQTAAYAGAFNLPNMILYLLIGGVASTAFITILTRYGEQGREEEGDRALSAILNVMTVVLLAAVILGEIFAPAVVWLTLKGFRNQPEVLALCVHLTRILLVGPLFFFAGGVFGARLLVRKIFLYQALAPVTYSGGIVLGAVLLHGRFGIDSLAIGAMFGAFAGPLLLNLFGARRSGMRWSPVWDLRHPALKEWLVLSLPLMLGQSLTTTDEWIRSYFASDSDAGMSRLLYARQLFAAPMSVLGPAAGIASLPFFAALWSQNRKAQFSAAVDRSVSRMIAVSFLASGWMIAFAPLLIDLALRGGRFQQTDASVTTRYFVLYTFSLFLWTSQNLYARGFYGAGDTRTPMISGTVVTLVSIPMYAALYRTIGLEGLVWGANIGMLLHTGSLAVLLHRKRMVSVAELEFAELGRSLAAAVAASAAAWLLRSALPAAHTHTASLLQLLGGSVFWLAIVFAMLRITGSRLPEIILRRGRKAAA